MAIETERDNIILETVQTRNATIWLEDDGIIRIVYIPNSEDRLEDAKAFSAAVKELSPDKRYPALADIRNIKSSTREARQHHASDGINLGPACALLVGSQLSSVIGNFFLKINKPNIPTKLFSSEPTAVAWLKVFIR
jgi:hypothetical protein